MSLLDRLVAAEREHAPTPSPEAAAQGWDRLRRALPGAVIVPEFDVAPGDLGSAAAGTAASPLTGVGKLPWWKWLGWSGWVGKTIVGGTVATVVAAGVLASRPDDARRTTTAATVVATAPATDDVDAGTPIAEPPPAIPEPAVLPIAPQVEPAVEPPTPRSATPARRDRSGATRGSTPSAPAATLDDEAALLRSANRALAADDTALALARLSEHASRFEHGALAQDRDALRVIVLCRAGRRDDAANARERFFDRWPASVHASRVRAACPDDQP